MKHHMALIRCARRSVLLVAACRFMKYNGLLRGFGEMHDKRCGNTYRTTMHVINSCIVKTSKLTCAAKVYRGVGAHLPPLDEQETNAEAWLGDPIKTA